MFLLYFAILGAAGVASLGFRFSHRSAVCCWKAATGLILLAFCVDLGRSLLTASPVDLGRTLGAAVVPLALGLMLCRVEGAEDQPRGTTSGR